MRIVQLRERDTINAISVSEMAGVSINTARWLILQLSDRGIIKPANVSDAEEVDVFDDAENDRFDDGTYRVVYVGVVVIDDLAVYCVPKYLRREVTHEELRPVFSALRRYQSDSEDTGISVVDEDGHINRISLLLALLTSYDEHGLYTNQERIIRTNGRGPIHWPGTISTHLPVLEDGSPVYVSYETAVSREIGSNFISRLHGSVVAECSSELEKCGLIDVFSLVPIELSDTPLIDFGDADSVMRRIEQEINVQFITWKLEVLKLMRSYFQLSPSIEHESGLACYGTNSFHVVWEKACKIAFNDMLDITLTELPIDLHEKWTRRQNETLRGIIPRPKWRIRMASGSLINCDPTNTLIPDIVTIQPKTTEKGAEFHIYDAKYYAPWFKRHLVKVPGIESVTKQLLYQSAYREFIVDNKFARVKNTFLIPHDGELFIEKGDVSFEAVADEGEPFTSLIEVVLAPATVILDCYIRQKPLNHSFPHH